jgi:hypothetical protein
MIIITTKWVAKGFTTTDFFIIGYLDNGVDTTDGRHEFDYTTLYDSPHVTLTDWEAVTKLIYLTELSDYTLKTQEYNIIGDGGSTVLPTIDSGYYTPTTLGTTWVHTTYISNTFLLNTTDSAIAGQYYELIP